MKQEKRGIYNVTFNEKKATPIRTTIQTDLEIIEEAIINEVTMYVKGWHNPNTGRGRGSNHIKHHLEKGSKGEISLEELLNLGNSLREYLKIFKEPFIDKKGGKVFEWENEKRVRFRAVIDNIKKDRVSSGTDLPSYTHSNQQIISFYSDRNFKQMEFKNPKVTQYYQSLKNTKEAQEALRKKVKESALKIQKQSKDKELER